MRRALVLAGGGVAAIAWELGVLLGVRDEAPRLDPDLLAADVIVGTSAGSTVAAQITSGVDLAALYDRQHSETSSEVAVDVDVTELFARFASATAEANSAPEARRRIGALALATPTIDEPVRRAAIAGQLPSHVWPDRPVLVPAVDAETGDVAFFTRESGVDLVDAVTASCAVPGVWPPATINGRRYVDGSVRSGSNADLAAGCDRVLVLTPTLPDAPQLRGSLSAEIERLNPAQVLVLYADEPSLTAFGTNPLSPATRRPAARAGRAVGRDYAAEVTRFWA
ncbi:patatin-like phospholipase family protein [Micromonospora sp. WP24]|uniref:patatin-like phospholipase family protein n=1 Tax=Micromonospora sp. WP24 TaxID=2604469 RepID=UPI0011D8DA91|nr:patatin-like phospholipase family protein [Micromonospora sp. WP24]TYC02908.1 patatin-like phospholipase family protein [Micromonospora sp. WP24]